MKSYKDRQKIKYDFSIPANANLEKKYARRIKAEEHIKYVEKKFESEIKQCIEESKVYSMNKFTDFKPKNKPYKKSAKYKLINTNTVTALFELDEVLNQNNIKYPIALLNFASYTNPGGGFIKGSMAQEEALCHDSILYNVLSVSKFNKEFYKPNLSRLKNGLYHSNMIYTPDIVFMHNKYNYTVYADVITCAAPNKTCAKRKNQYLLDCEVEEVLRDRIKSILSAAYKNSIKYLILGAFGCGAFGNDPYLVASIFKELLETDFKGAFKQVIFAIPNKKSPNYIAFDKVLFNKDK